MTPGYWDRLVLERQRHLKWRAFDPLEKYLMILCGVALFGFSASTLIDILTRSLGHPVLSLQETTSAFFVYGVFIGAGVATRRNDHLYLTAFAEALHGRARMAAELVIRVIVLCVAIVLIYYGYLNYLRGFGSFRLPSNTPIASLYAAIPLSGVLIALFTIEQILNGCRNGFERPEPEQDAVHTAAFGASRPDRSQ
jgi:TRAP-type C4-dicarboxylate transport system permease small subunit